MKERPILYSPKMILARREGRKTQTRRIVEPQSAILTDEMARSLSVRPPEQKNQPVIACPKGKPGDRLWVQENHRMRLGTKEREVEVEYSADDELGIVQLTEAEWEKMLARQTKVTKCFGPIIPGRFMYRSLSRGLDEITAVRVERLREITEEDAMSEGCPSDEMCSAKTRYEILWCNINGTGSLANNPFVWVITFKVIQ